MFKVRCRFHKRDDIIFISHLDLIRVFERAIRRAEIPISYTKGFNPHPIMAFATALGVGVSSEAEYIDIQLDSEMKEKELMEKLNNKLPSGLRLLQCKYISPSEDSLMSIIRQSVYMVKFTLTRETTVEEVREAISSFMKLEVIIEEKEKKKKGRRENTKIITKNIRPLIYQLSFFDKDGDDAFVKMILATGSVDNLKPEVVIKKLYDNSSLAINLDTIRIHRLELLKEEEGELLTPLENLTQL